MKRPHNLSIGQEGPTFRWINNNLTWNKQNKLYYVSLQFVAPQEWNNERKTENTRKRVER